MATNIITVEDLDNFKSTFFEHFESEMRKFLVDIEKYKILEKEGKRWLKSDQVQRMLNISPSTLQNFRINGLIPYFKIGGVLFYSFEDIVKVMEASKSTNI